MQYKRQAEQSDCPICNALPMGMLVHMRLRSLTAQLNCCSVSLKDACHHSSRAPALQQSLLCHTACPAGREEETGNADRVVFMSWLLAAADYILLPITQCSQWYCLLLHRFGWQGAPYIRPFQALQHCPAAALSQQCMLCRKC